MRTGSEGPPPAVPSLGGAADEGVSVSRATAILNERHREWRVERKALAKAARREKWIDSERRVDVDRLEAELAGLICRYDGCERVALGVSGGCAAHGHVLVGAGAAGVPRSVETKAKISATMQDHAVAPKTRAKIATAHRKQPGQRRYCEREGCGQQIIPDRNGLDDVPGEVLAELGLDLVPGSVIADGGGHFCSISCHLLWAWAHDRDRFPQDGPGPATFSCDLCGRNVERWPSQVKNREAGRYRFICTVCIPIYRRYRYIATTTSADAKPRNPFSRASLAAFDQLWELGEKFEDEILADWPRTGRRPPLRVDLVILALHRPASPAPRGRSGQAEGRRPPRSGFTDATIRELLNHALQNGKKIPGVKEGRVLPVQYVELRRHRANIRRRPAHPISAELVQPEPSATVAAAR